MAKSRTEALARGRRDSLRRGSVAISGPSPTRNTLDFICRQRRGHINSIQSMRIRRMPEGEDVIVMTHHLFFSRDTRRPVIALLATMVMILTLLAFPDRSGAQRLAAQQGETSVDITQSCLAGRGRVDVLVTPGGMTADLVELSVTVGKLAPRTRQVARQVATRTTVTGRPEGPLPVVVAINGDTVASKTLTVDCSPKLTAPTVKASCLAGYGRVDVLTPDGTDFVVSFPGLPDRTIKGVTGRAGRATWTGRSDGVYTIKAVSGSGVTTELGATVTCAVGPEPGELAVKASCLANRGRLDISYRAEETGQHEVGVGALTPRAHSLQKGAVVRETVTGRPDGSLAVAIKRNGTEVAKKTVTVECEVKPTPMSLSLQAYEDCPAFLGDIKTKALEEVNEWGLGFYGEYPMPEITPMPTPGVDTADEPPTYSETNNQVAGVDEPDLMKTNGELLFVAHRNTVRMYTTNGGTATFQDILSFDGDVNSIFLDGSNVIAIVEGSGRVYYSSTLDFGPYSDDGTFRLVQMPVVAPGAGSTKHQFGDESTVTLDGNYVDARLSGGLIRMVSTNTPNLKFVYPEYPYTEASRAAALAANRKVIQESTVSDWLGTYTVTGADGSKTTRTISNCSDMYLPEPFSGFASLAVTTVDPKTMNVTPGPGVLSDGQHVYSSGDSLYVATEQWHPTGFEDPMPQVLNAPIESTYTTQIHKFDTTQVTPTYEGSGRVRGHLLNQFALHEYGGNLFVASTDGAQWWGNTADAASYITVLEQGADRLVQIGQVGNLGVGERIYAVRYIDNAAYVVTFRQVDPLYVVDLRDPKAPKVTGELKIPGFSSYLHPIGGGRLLGVGSEADDRGFVTGAKLSVFDVNNPAKPTETATWTQKDADFLASWEHHAFTWWSPRNYAILPTMAWSDGRNQGGAKVFSVSGSEIKEIGTATDSQISSTALRSTVIGDHMWTLTDMGLTGHSLNDLSRTEEIIFPV